jgi:hypothetical protein
MHLTVYYKQVLADKAKLCYGSAMVNFAHHVPGAYDRGDSVTEDDRDVPAGSAPDVHKIRVWVGDETLHLVRARLGLGSRVQEVLGQGHLGGLGRHSPILLYS